MNPFCAFTGFRPEKLQINEGTQGYFDLLKDIEKEIIRAYFQGYRTFLYGGARGMDIACAELVIQLKEEYSDVRLIAILPHEEQSNNWSNYWRERYFSILENSDDVIYMQNKYSKDCMHKRNRMLVDRSSKVIAVYDGMGYGGTAYTVSYARKKCVDVIIINPEKYRKE